MARVGATLTERRDCPKCRYPMLRASRLGGVSDAVRPPTLEESWLPPLAAQVLLFLLSNALGVAVMTGVVLLYLAAAPLPYGPELLSACLLLVGALLAWKFRVWTVWTPRPLDYSGAAEADPWQGPTLLTQRRTSSRVSGGNRGAEWLGKLVFLMLCVLQLSSPLTANLGILAGFNLALAGWLGFSLPVLLFRRGVASLSGARRHKRLRLMRELAPDDWVCPNCLHAEKA